VSHGNRVARHTCRNGVAFSFVNVLCPSFGIGVFM
jgi:hypothetical protein